MTDNQKKPFRPSGRPRQSPLGTVHVNLTIPAEYRETLLRLGGSRWVTQMIKEAIEKEAKEQEAKS